MNIEKKTEHGVSVFPRAVKVCGLNSRQLLAVIIQHCGAIATIHQVQRVLRTGEAPPIEWWDALRAYFKATYHITVAMLENTFGDDPTEVSDDHEFHVMQEPGCAELGPALFSLMCPPGQKVRVVVMNEENGWHDLRESIH